MYGDFVLSQTALKKWEEGCRRKWYGMWIEKSIPFYSNPKMDYGKYFEYYAIGGSAKEEDIVTELPRVRGGKLSAANIRIDKQIKRFKELFDPSHIDYLGMTISSVQDVIWSPDKLKRGVLDVLATDDETNEEIIVDLKLTSDTDLVMHPKFWGHPDDQLDVTQAEYYINMFHENGRGLPKFTYLVFDYSPRENVKQVDVVIEDEEGLNDIKGRIKSFRRDVEVDSFDEIPDKMECSSCPLECKSRISEFKY